MQTGPSPKSPNLSVITSPINARLKRRRSGKREETQCWRKRRLRKTRLPQPWRVRMVRMVLKMARGKVLILLLLVVLVVLPPLRVGVSRQRREATNVAEVRAPVVVLLEEEVERVEVRLLVDQQRVQREVPPPLLVHRVSSLAV